MGRRRKTKPKGNKTPLTVRHLVDSNPFATRFEHDPYFGRRHPTSTLGWTGLRDIPYSPKAVAADLRHFGSRASVIVDSNIFLAETPHDIWDALFETGQLTLVEPVLEEIRHWLVDPRGINTRTRESLVRAVKQRGVQIFQIPADERSLRYAFEHYVNLLGMRRYARDVVSLQQGLEADASNQDTNNLVYKLLGQRAPRLALSADRTKDPTHRFYDEAIVLSAAFRAIMDGRETVILTRDENVFEQFYKTCWFLDTHWRATLFAAQYAGDPFAFGVPFRVRDANSDIREWARLAFASDDTLLLCKPSGSLREILPRRMATVPVHCCLMRDKVNILTFGLVREMLSLLGVKAKTQGRNTSLLEERNCHICLGPLVEKVGDWAAIGHDSIINFGPQRYSILDCNLALGTCEGTERTFLTSLYIP